MQFNNLSFKEVLPDCLKKKIGSYIKTLVPDGSFENCSKRLSQKVVGCPCDRGTTEAFRFDVLFFDRY